MTLADENTRLRAENAELRQTLAQLQQQLATALQRIAELEQQRDPPPPFVKPNRVPPSEPKRPRKKRAAQHNHARPRATPTRIEQHLLDRCPTCGYRLRGTSVDYTRQVIELPPPQPVEIIEHQVIKRWCPCCTRWRSPRLDLTRQIVGQGRIGIRIASLIAYLRTTLRLPVRRIQTYLHTVHHLRLSTGAIVRLLHQVRRTSQPAVAALQDQARASPILHGDETGWRENGQHGYIWSFSTPGRNGVRYYEYDPSRGQQVVRRILGHQFQGHLVSDFYGSYNVYSGKHQRCWVHLLRDLHTLQELHAQNQAVMQWAQAIHALYNEARTWQEQTSEPLGDDCNAIYGDLVERLHQLGLCYAQEKKHPCQALAKRLLRHEDELFQFVLVAGLSADNNLAERSIRPLVVVRKISGGSRSPEGTRTRMALASLFETWQARGLNPFVECLHLLSQTPLPQL
jgi:transposase